MVITQPQGVVPMGERAYEQARICDGRPAADSELTEKYNPLEAGLQSAISLTKVDSFPHVCELRRYLS